MPKPNEGESEADYISRCIPIVIKEGTAKDQKQAAAICYSMYREKHKQDNMSQDILPNTGESQDGFIGRCIPFMVDRGIFPDTEYGRIRAKGACMGIWSDGYRPSSEEQPRSGDDTVAGVRASTQRITRQFNGHTQILYTFDADCDKAIIFEPEQIQLDANTDNKYTAVAVIGDRFYKNKFVSYDELVKSYHTMDGSYHDINHWGTTFTDGNPNIEYIVGYQKNTILDPISKKMRTDIYINETAPKYGIWKNFVDINQKAGRTPNVSVSFWASTMDMQAKALGRDINYQIYGYKDDDMIPYLYDIEFQALSTVFQGACNDHDGCGIGVGLQDSTKMQKSSTDNDDNEKKVLELMIEIEKEKNKQKLGGKRNYD